MNARQKAKYYKRKYENLVKQPVLFKMERHKIDTLQFEQFFPAQIIKQENDAPRKWQIDSASDDIIYLDTETENFRRC